jgi:hypothetical protein
MRVRFLTTRSSLASPVGIAQVEFFAVDAPDIAARIDDQFHLGGHAAPPDLAEDEKRVR